MKTMEIKLDVSNFVVLFALEKKKKKKKNLFVQKKQNNNNVFVMKKKTNTLPFKCINFKRGTFSVTCFHSFESTIAVLGPELQCFLKGYAPVICSPGPFGAAE